MKSLKLSPNDLKTRVEEDIEFVNMLSNPFYIDFLIKHNYFEEETFLYYLKHLDYLKDQKMIKFIKYPIALKLLQNIQDTEFINTWKQRPNFAADLTDQLFATTVYVSKAFDDEYKSIN